MPPLRYPHLPAANDAPPVVPGPRSVDGRIKHGRKSSVAHKSIYKSINGDVGKEFFIISRMPGFEYFFPSISIKCRFSTMDFDLLPFLYPVVMSGV